MRSERPRIGLPAHEFQVLWSQARARFDIWRDGVLISASSPGRSSAVGLAIRHAQMESLSTGRYIIVTSQLNGKRIVEWEGR